MRKRVAVFFLTLGAFLAFGLVNATAATAAPITCPGGQTVTKTSGGWDCVNNGGNTSNAENPKNPNAGKGFF
ncbi:MAG: hypothetical protein HOV79_30470 [Hamadaea sp.]|nr:hypothetical protein [Hamadaea sp.]